MVLIRLYFMNEQWITRLQKEQVNQGILTTYLHEITNVQQQSE